MFITPEFQEKAKDIVNQAASFIKENLSLVTSNDVVEKGTNSLVSYVDQQAEKILVVQPEFYF